MKRHVGFGAVLLGTFLLTVSSTVSAQTEIRLGYQRGDFATVMIEQELLEARFGPDVAVTWTLFTSGPPMLEALAAGSIDFARTGDTPPIFAQAAGTPFVYAGAQRAVTREALLVPEDSDIENVADLAGRTLAYSPGSSANYFAVQALETGGLTLDDVESVPLQPADARAAFQGGSIDAWAIWDPFMTAAVAELGARIVLTRDDTGGEYDFYLASQAFAEANPELVAGILDEYNTAVAWAGSNLEDFTALLEAGIDQDVWSESLADRTFHELTPVSSDIVESQQAAADTLAEIGLIPEAVTVADNVWTWEEQEAAR